jgi:hypothetical protein
VRIGGLKDVAWGPIVATGVSAPSYSGGFAVWLGVLDVGCGGFLSLGGDSGAVRCVKRPAQIGNRFFVRRREPHGKSGTQTA